MRFVGSCMVLIGFLLAGTGCATMGKKSNGGDRPPSGDSRNQPRPAAPAANDPILGGSSAAPKPAPPATAAVPSQGSILAGRVIDPYDHAPGNAFVRWVSMDDKDGANNVDVAVNPDGYFTIQGLKPGVQYKLIARAKNGDRMLAGVTYTAAPNIRVLIQVRDGFATADIPPVPGNPAFQGTDSKPATTNTGASGGWAPVNGMIGKATPNSVPNAIGVGRPGNEPDLPVQMKVPLPQQSVGITPSPNWTPAGEPTRTWPPTLEIPGPRPQPSVDIKKPEPLTMPQGEPPPPMFPGTNAAPPPTQNLTARVPSCVLVGKQLVNFALNDINGETFEFRANKRGKVILLDFWATYCLPCQKTMPQIRSLQNRYGSQGLEVIGVAYETGGSTQEQAHRVNTVAQRLQVNYRQLLGTGPQCPVKTQLNIQYVPTLILVDEAGWILWRHEGQPDRNTLDELERRIQRALTGRPS